MSRETWLAPTQTPCAECLRRGFTHSSIVTSRIGARLVQGSLAWFALSGRGQQPVVPVAGGMPALEVVADRGQLLRVRVRVRLATVPAAQAAHHIHGPFPHGGVALRAVSGKKHGQPVGVHTSSFWATVRWPP
jgi:hypothetical protein